MTLVTDCITLDLPTLQDPRGDLTFIEGTIGNRKGHLPFEIRRIYYLYNVPGSSMRGGHAHLSLHQYAIAMAGSFDMVMDDGRKRQRLHLDSAHQALYIPPMIWHELENFSPGSICLVLASDIYDETDYVRNYREFLAMIESLESETMGNCVSPPPRKRASHRARPFHYRPRPGYMRIPDTCTQGQRQPSKPLMPHALSQHAGYRQLHGTRCGKDSLCPRQASRGAHIRTKLHTPRPARTYLPPAL